MGPAPLEGLTRHRDYAARVARAMNAPLLLIEVPTPVLSAEAGQRRRRQIGAKRTGLEPKIGPEFSQAHRAALPSVSASPPLPPLPSLPASPSLPFAAGTTTRDYDDQMRLTKITPADIGNDATRTRTIAYDPIGQITEKRWPSGFTAAPITHTYAYLPDQNLAAATDGRGYTTSYGYDGFGRRNSETAPGSYSHQGDQTYDSQTTRWSYDPNSMITERISPADTRFSFDYDALDRLVKETNPAGESWRYAYDSASQTTAEISPRGLADPDDAATDFQTTYHYDPADRLVEINAPYHAAGDAGGWGLHATGDAAGWTYHATGDAFCALPLGRC